MVTVAVWLLRNSDWRLFDGSQIRSGCCGTGDQGCGIDAKNMCCLFLSKRGWLRVMRLGVVLREGGWVNF